MIRKEVKQRNKSQEVIWPFKPNPFYEMKFLWDQKKKGAELFMEMEN